MQLPAGATKGQLITQDALHRMHCTASMYSDVHSLLVCTCTLCTCFEHDISSLLSEILIVVEKDRPLVLISGHTGRLHGARHGRRATGERPNLGNVVMNVLQTVEHLIKLRPTEVHGRLQPGE
eukprot:scpid25808/ scgid29471/ 